MLALSFELRNLRGNAVRIVKRFVRGKNGYESRQSATCFIELVFEIANLEADFIAFVVIYAANQIAYCASKAAVSNMTRAMALDHAAEGIRINAVCPGAVDTDMLYSERDDSVEEVRSMNLPGIPEGRLPAGEEVAHVVSFLADERSRHVNGANVSVDGGYTAQ